MTRLRYAALAAATLASSAHAAVPLASCDDPSFQQVLHASSATLDARAVWLDRQLLTWPGADAGGSFRLYHSSAAAIVARPGAKVEGADGALALEASGARLPTRFKYLAAGPVLSVRAADLARLKDLHRGQLVLVQEAPDGTVRAATRIQSAGALDDLYAAADDIPDLGATPKKGRTAFRLWAPTARTAAVCTYDSAGGRLSMPGPMPVPAGKSAQLWAILDDGAPHPLGLFQQAGERVEAEARSATPMPAGTTFAISIEPLGGSPTGAPTGPVVGSATLIRA